MYIMGKGKKEEEKQSVGRKKGKPESRRKMPSGQQSPVK